MEKKWRKNQLLCHFLSILWIHKNHNSLCDEGVRKRSVAIQKAQMVLDICPFAAQQHASVLHAIFVSTFCKKDVYSRRIGVFFAEPYPQPSVMSIVVKQQLLWAEESPEDSVIVTIKYSSNKTSMLQQHETGKPKMLTSKNFLVLFFK